MILTLIDKSIYTQRILKKAAIIIYNYLARLESCRRFELVSELSRNLPADVSRSQLSEIVDKIIHFAEQRGDLTQLPGRRLRFLPPYIIGRKENNRFILYGHWGVQNQVEILIAQFGGKLDQNLIQEESEIGEYCLGVERSIQISSNVNEFLAEISKHQIKLIDLNSLAQRLPNINQLYLPSDESMRVITTKVNWLWQCYDALDKHPYHAGRWKKIESLDGWNCLVRCSPPVNASERETKRYFYLNSPDRGFELSREEALLWQFKLSHDYKNEVNFSYKRQSLWFNGWLPASIYQWLNQQTTSETIRVEMQSNFPIHNMQVPEIEIVLVEKLGVRVERVL